MKPFEYGTWHVWQGTAHVIVSDQSSGELSYFKDCDAAINWLYLRDKPAARALNAHKKVTP